MQISQDMLNKSLISMNGARSTSEWSLVGRVRRERERINLIFNSVNIFFSSNIPIFVFARVSRCVRAPRSCTQDERNSFSFFLCCSFFYCISCTQEGREEHIGVERKKQNTENSLKGLRAIQDNHDFDVAAFFFLCEETGCSVGCSSGWWKHTEHRKIKIFMKFVLYKIK